MLSYDLLAYGDAKPVTRKAAKSPGRVSVIVRQPAFAPVSRLDLDVYPSTGFWELVSIVGDERTTIAHGFIDAEEISVDAPEGS